MPAMQRLGYITTTTSMSAPGAQVRPLISAARALGPVRAVGRPVTALVTYCDTYREAEFEPCTEDFDVI